MLSVLELKPHDIPDLQARVKSLSLGIVYLGG